jgi:class 3 adenylate cyclase
MEQNIAILVADLSGYTALTETHGALSAADLIDKYIEIVNNSLVGNSVLHERVGDEVMIVSASPDNLLSTAIVLLNNVLQQYKFLHIHGGLHYGKVLKRNNSFFGSTINLTSRIASQAKPGIFLCSEDYLSSLADKKACSFNSLGKYNFKNVSEERELFEIIAGEPTNLHVDPVCRMLLNADEEHVSHPGNSNIFFCSVNCREIYLKNEIIV